MKGIKYFIWILVFSLSQMLDPRAIIIISIGFIVIVVITYIFVLIYILNPCVKSVKAFWIVIKKRQRKMTKAKNRKRSSEKEKEYG